jgi:PadR family transcriptional regulator AphA
VRGDKPRASIHLPTSRVCDRVRVARAADDLSLAEWVCLALIVEHPRHGWSLVRELATDGAIGRVWSLSRPLTYRAVDGLLTRELVAHRGAEAGGGPTRQVLHATPRGRRVAEKWLTTPVVHMRDVRTELLLKLVLGERRGRDPRPLLRAQRDVFEPHEAALRVARRRTNADDVDLWRYESSVAVRRFLDGAIRAADRRYR